MPQYYTVHFSRMTLNVLYLQIDQLIDAYQSFVYKIPYRRARVSARAKESCIQTKVNLQLIFVVCPKKWPKMQYLTKNQVKLIFEVKYPFNYSGNPFKRYFGARYP